jgi:8-oxo-dGTP diphosphatase
VSDKIVFPTRGFAIAILFDTSGRLLLQLRDNIPNILFPGKISLFGGHREGDESYLECIVREIHEELSYYVPPERFLLLSQWIEPDHAQPGGKLYAELFLAREIPVTPILVTEGTLQIVAATDIDGISENLTPTTLFALEKFFGRELLKSSGTLA